MSPKKLHMSGIIAAMACLLVVGAVVTDVRAAVQMSRSDFYRFRTWTRLHDELGDVERRMPYPGLTIAAPDDDLGLKDDPLETAAFSLLDLEDHLVREWERARYYTADRNLNVARSYRDVGEFHEAMRWYRRAVHGPEAVKVRGPKLRHEMFAVAVLSSDSLLVTEELLNLLGRSDLSDEAESLEVAFRWLLATEDRLNLDHAMAKVGRRLDEVGDRVLFWYAFVLADRGERAGCHDVIEILLAREPAPASFDRAERGWLLRTYADIHFLDGDRDDALRLYHLLAASAHADPGDWGRYQLANHHFMSGEYDEAGAIYTSFCGGDGTPSAWAERACEMADYAALLERTREEGETYGTDVIHRR